MIEGIAPSLSSRLVASYDEIDDDGSFTGTIHRAWINVKSLFGNNDKSMLQEAVQGDKAAIEEYEEVLEYPALPVQVATIFANNR